ncbi:MAG: hypothetical protein SF182_06360 [Deltaproteobacteria bacterium]|nr:hypothetical protein [Deltaproteobacteria bacterium]
MSLTATPRARNSSPSDERDAGAAAGSIRGSRGLDTRRRCRAIGSDASGISGPRSAVSDQLSDAFWLAADGEQPTTADGGEPQRPAAAGTMIVSDDRHSDLRLTADR